MPPTRVIGIDAGGTKLLGGVVDEQMVVHHRVHRTWRGADRQETLDIFTGAVEEVRAAAPEVEVVGFGVPALVEWETGVSRWSNHLPALDGVPFRDLMSERLGLPVVVDNDGNASMLAEARSGAAAGASHAVMVSLGTGIGGGLLRERRGVPGRDRRGRRARARGAAAPRAGLPRRLSRARAASRRSCPGTRSAARGCGWRQEKPDSQLGRRLAAEKEISGGLVTELAHDGRPARSGGARRDGAEARLRARRARQHVQPRGDRDRRRSGARRRHAARARRARWWRSGRCRRRARWCGSCRPTTATRPG